MGVYEQEAEGRSAMVFSHKGWKWWGDVVWPDVDEHSIA